MTKYTPNQQQVIDTRGSNILVSASAGTGKTTVMIERIYQMISSGEVDIGNIMVVTFTNLAASEMKHRLATKLMSDNRAGIASQLEDIDNCAISTLHSFCSDLLRNYFYVVDIDPSYTILDETTASALQQQALDDVLKQYYTDQDEVFDRLYAIFADNRKDIKLRQEILSQYDFASTLVDYQSWYNSCRQHYMTLDNQDNVLVSSLVQDILTNYHEVATLWRELGQLFDSYGMSKHAKDCYHNNAVLSINHQDIAGLITLIQGLELCSLSRVMSNSIPQGVDQQYLMAIVKNTKDATKELQQRYALFEGKSWQQLVQESVSTIQYTDKLVEIVLAFKSRYYQLKKQRATLDFADLEHLTLTVLQDKHALSQLQNKYKYVFVDEYQDTNAVQEAIISQLAKTDNLFVVGDIKQSIYAFRGCDPLIFLQQYNRYRDGKGVDGKAIVLNDNFRSNRYILNFSNIIFSHVMTAKFGKVNYRQEALLKGEKEHICNTPIVNIDVIDNNRQEQQLADGIYDITAVTQDTNALSQGKVIAKRILSIVGSTIKLSDGTVKRISFGDIAILSRSMTAKAREIYNQLVKHNIPVVAPIKASDNVGKEIRDIITLLRVIDNADNDIYMVGCCLSCFGKLSESDLATVRLATNHIKGTFHQRLNHYLHNNVDSISDKVSKLLQLIDKLRLVSQSACVDEVLLTLLTDTDYQLYIEGMPNGHLRTRQLFNYIDSLKDLYYAQSVDKYLQHIDNTDSRLGSTVSGGNAVKMMTMHASKGLEYDVVFVVNCETAFKIDHNIVARNKSMGMAIDHYDTDNMTTCNSVGRFCCDLSTTISAKEEEMRLLYVALTRAKYHLFVVTSGTKLLATSPNKIVSANNHASWIFASLAGRYGQLEDGFCQDNISIKVWDNSSMLDTQQMDNSSLLCPQSDNLQQVLDSINYQYPYRTAIDAPSKVVSSLLDARHMDNAEQFKVVSVTTDMQHYADIGTAYHRLLEEVALASTLDTVNDTLARLVECGEIDKTIATSIDCNMVHRAINNSQLLEVCQGKLYREVPFMHSVDYNQVADTNITDKVILQGIIDLLVISDNSAVVIDYKYISNSSNVRQRYYRQLHSYCLAVQQITGISNVDSYIMSIKDNRLIKMN